MDDNITYLNPEFEKAVEERRLLMFPPDTEESVRVDWLKTKEIRVTPSATWEITAEILKNAYDIAKAHATREKGV